MWKPRRQDAIQWFGYHYPQEERPKQSRVSMPIPQASRQVWYLQPTFLVELQDTLSPSSCALGIQGSRRLETWRVNAEQGGGLLHNPGWPEDSRAPGADVPCAASPALEREVASSKMKSCCVVQTGLKFLGASDSPASAFRAAGTQGCQREG